VVWSIYGVLGRHCRVLLGMFLGVSSYSVVGSGGAFSIVVCLAAWGAFLGSLIAAFVVARTSRLSLRARASAEESGRGIISV